MNTPKTILSVHFENTVAPDNLCNISSRAGAL